VAETVRVSAIARRYADAYFDLALEAKQVTRWRDELAAASDGLAQQSVVRALDNPQLSPAERVRLGLQLLEGASPQVRNLVRLLIERRRVRILPELLARFDERADREAGVVRAHVTTAVAVDAQIRNAIERALSQRFGTDVQTEVDEDPAILGGLVVRVGDRVIDDSLRTHLQQLQAALA
jgi:F-type H+-transporting ATPase subunit delta